MRPTRVRSAWERSAPVKSTRCPGNGGKLKKCMPISFAPERSAPERSTTIVDSSLAVLRVLTTVRAAWSAGQLDARGVG